MIKYNEIKQLLFLYENLEKKINSLISRIELIEKKLYKENEKQDEFEKNIFSSKKGK